MITLEKIDIVRERTGVSYKEAKEALEQNDGDVVETIIFIEEKHGKTWMDTMSVVGNEIVEKLKTVIKKGNVSRIILKKDGEVLLNVPVTAGAIGVMLYPTISLLGVATALFTKATIEIVKDSGEVVDINEMAEETVSEIKNMVGINKGAGTNNEKSSDIIVDNKKHDETMDNLDDEYF
ncbi:MAG TPA: DUF4342 domain-containing protein [Clostridia bacterium]|nr:DUF4342 domain-containing protein [Clostridia bacterium]